MSKELTKQMLVDEGIQIHWDQENNAWCVMKWSRKNKSKKMVLNKLKESILKRKHKYAPDKEYPGYVWSKTGSKGYKSTTVATGRLIYAYFVGDIPAGYEIDHIDNNPFNNSLNNLRLLTKEENLRKRYSDNPGMCNNHYEYCKKHNLTVDK